MKNLINYFSSGWAKLQESESKSPIVILLACFSIIYGLGIKLHHLKARIKTKQSLPGFVVSIGNLTVGGTGKTPATLMLAKWAKTQGFKVAVLSRGYGGSSKKKILEVTDNMPRTAVDDYPFETGSRGARIRDGNGYFFSVNRDHAALFAIRR